jgi:class 3 adenylate cyclase/tetratricopeptide (TPR) repeat protein
MNCPNCQTSNPEGARFCLNCGASLQAPRPVEGERKFVTVLFADVVDSTAMGEQLDPEQVAEIMDGALSFLNTSVTKHGGTVARLLGDAVLAFFGAPVAHEDDAERAVRTGLDIQAKAKEYEQNIERDYGVDFEVRVGINTGLAVLTTVGDETKTEYTAMGDTTNVAARMQKAARSGTVLISANTYHLVKNVFDFNPRGAIEVKGKSAPIETYEVLAAKTVPGPARGLEGVTSPLVGRDAEVQFLQEKLEGLRVGQGAFVAVVGEAGLGKSRLIAEVRNLVNSDSESQVVWMEGRAISYGRAITYYPWQQVVRGTVGARAGDTPATIRERLRLTRDRYGLPDEDLPFLEALLGVEGEESSQTVMGLAGEALIERITKAARDYISGLAQTTPTVIAFDDLHWADTASLKLLLNVSDLVESYPLLLVCLLRPDKDAASWSALERARERLGMRFTEIMLEPLDAAHTQELLGNLLYIEDLPESVHDLILQKAEGNPFFVEEVIRTLIDSRHIVRDNNHWRATREIVNVAIPETLTGLLSARIDRLPDDTKRVAQTGAVLGRIFAYRALAAVCAAAPPNERVEDVESHLGTLTYEELVRERARDPELEYIFKHALTQEAAYELLLIRRRKELHRRAGAVLERLYEGRTDERAAMLAHHFWVGEDWVRAAGYSMRAGARARMVYALSEALDHYERACQAMDKLAGAPPGKLIDAIIAWTEVAYKLKRYQETLPRLTRAEQIARELNDKPRLALALHWIGAVHLAVGSPSRAIPALAENAQLADEIGDERLSVVPRFFTAMAMADSDPRSAVAQLEHVIDLARVLQDEEIEAHTLAIKAVAHGRLGEFVQAQEDLRRALEVAIRSNSAVKEAEADFLSALVYLDMGDLQRGLEHSQRGAQRAQAANAMECAVAGFCYVGLGNLRTQDWPKALTAFGEALRLSEFSGLEDVNNQVRAGLAIAQFFSGRIEAIDDMKKALTNAQALGDAYTAAFLSQYLGEAYTRLGEFEQAGSYLNTALEHYRRNDMRPYLVRALQSLVYWYEQQGRSAEAEQARAEARQLMAELPLPPIRPLSSS